MSGIGDRNRVYICASTESLDALYREDGNAGNLIDTLHERFPGLRDAELHDECFHGEAPWNVMLGADARRMHILAYDYTRSDACQAENTLVLQTRKLKPKYRDLPPRLIKEYLTHRTITFDRFADGRRIPSRVNCEGSLVIVSNVIQAPSLLEQYAAYVRAGNGTPHVLEEAYHVNPPVIEPLVNDDWKKSLGD